MHIHSNISVDEAIKLQQELSHRVVLHGHPKHIELVAGADVACDTSKKLIYGTIVILSYPELQVIEIKSHCQPLLFPYIPGLLSFREGPVLTNTYRKLVSQPDVILFDGQGIAHPRKLGIASHLGVLWHICTIGCAKSRLIGEYKEPALHRGAYTYLKHEGKTIGAVVRTRTGVKPMFVSPGNLIDLHSSIKIVLNCCDKYRLPEPIRLAHHLVKKSDS